MALRPRSGARHHRQNHPKCDEQLNSKADDVVRSRVAHGNVLVGVGSVRYSCRPLDGQEARGVSSESAIRSSVPAFSQRTASGTSPRVESVQPHGITVDRQANAGKVRQDLGAVSRPKDRRLITRIQAESDASRQRLDLAHCLNVSDLAERCLPHGSDSSKHPVASVEPEALLEDVQSCKWPCRGQHAETHPADV